MDTFIRAYMLKHWSTHVVTLVDARRYTFQAICLPARNQTVNRTRFPVPCPQVKPCRSDSGSDSPCLSPKPTPFPVPATHLSVKPTPCPSPSHLPWNAPHVPARCPCLSQPPVPKLRGCADWLAHVKGSAFLSTPPHTWWVVFCGNTYTNPSPS